MSGTGSKGNQNAQKARRNGRTSPLLEARRKDWADVEDIADHVADFGGLVYATNTAANGTLSIHLGASLEHAHDALDAVIAGKGRALYFRVYVLDPEWLMDEEPEDDGDEG